MKQNPKITQDKESELIQLRGDYEACREIATLKDHPGWVRIREILEANRRVLKDQREDFQKLNEHGLRFILKEEQDFEFFLALVDKVDERMQRLQEEISKAHVGINERKRTTPTDANTATGV